MFTTEESDEWDELAPVVTSGITSLVSDAPSTRIQIFLNLKLVLSGFTCPHASDRSRIYSRVTRPSRCAAILGYCSVRDWTRFCYVIGFKNIRIHRPQVIGFVQDFLFFSLWRADYSDWLPNSPDTLGGKTKVADFEISGYVCTKPITQNLCRMQSICVAGG